MRRLYRIGGLVGALLLSVGTVLAIGIPEASAQSGNQFCYYDGGYACLNAWGGGPWVNTYTGGPNTQNNDFTLIGGSTGSNWQIEDTGGNSGSGECIGDAYNESGQADTYLDTCGTGWGTNFTIAYGTGDNGCPDNTIMFYDNHWGGYLGPPNGWVNGSHFYLNKPSSTPICFTEYGAAG
jgi:hypothetical protein